MATKTKEKSTLKVSEVLGKETSSKKETKYNIMLDYPSPRGFNVVFEANYNRLDPKKILAERYEIVKKANGEKVKSFFVDAETKTVRPKTLIHQTESGKAVDKNDIKQYFVNKLKGTEEEMKKAKFLKYVKNIPLALFHSWLDEGTFEFWNSDLDDEHKRLKMVDDLAKHSEVAVYRFSPNGTTYYGFFIPVIENGTKYGLVCKVARMEYTKNLRHIQERSQAKARKVVYAEMLEEI